jgi:hypothetical protein
MNLILNSYVQKSLWFLYPLLGIKKSVNFKPVQSYLKNPHKGITEEDYKLICVYKKTNDERFSYFEDIYLFNNYYFKDYYETKSYLVYTFDLSDYKEDFRKVLNGEYSQLSSKVKSIINGYFAKFDEHGLHPHPKIQAYLFPNDEVYEQIAEELNIAFDLIKKRRDILDRPDLVKETLALNEDEYIKDQIEETSTGSDAT